MIMKFCQKVCLFVSFMLSLIVLSKGNVCYNFSGIRNDVFMNRYTYRHIEASTVYECASECMTSSVCESFNFDTESHTCHLNSNSSELVDVDTRPGFLFSDIKHWNKPLVGSCSTVSCSANSQCKTTKNHQMQCVQEFQGCGRPPEIPDTDLTYNGHFINAEANYTCRSDFRSCDTPTGSVCQDTSKWTDPKLHCDRFKWHNLTTPVDVRLPCEGKPIGIIKIKGTPTLDIIFRFRGDIRQIVLNSRSNGRWQRKIKPTEPFPFTVNKTFYMEIRLMDGIYKISIDGTAPLQFKERMSVAIPDSVKIGGYVIVEYLEAVV